MSSLESICDQRRILSIGILCLIWMALSDSAYADDWESYQHDPQRTGFSSSALDPATLSLSWTAPQGFTEPLIVGNSVLAIKNQNLANAPATVDSFNIANGALNWSTSVNFSASSQMAYGGGMVAFVTSVLSNNTYINNLNVLNASSGTLLYSVQIPESSGSAITIATDTTSNQPVAYVSDGRSDLTAVRLGASSGSTLWTATGLLSGGQAPSVAGNLLISSSPEQYYAINRTTGAVNEFYKGPASGGGGSAPVVDTAHQRFYILDDYDQNGAAVNTLTAYSYGGSAISQLWQITNGGFGVNATPALDASGNVYVANGSTLEELDPTSGQVLRSVSGSFVFNNAPILTNKYVFDFGPRGSPTYAYAYNLSDLSLAAQIEVDPLNTALYQGAAIDDTHFIEDFGGAQESHGFEVFSGVPEPSSVVCLSILAAVAVLRRPLRMCL